MSRIAFRDFRAGWFPMGDRSAMPPATLRRALGASAIRTGVLRTRNGCTSLFPTLSAHSLFRFRGDRFQGVSTGLYRNGVLVRGSLSGDRLTFMAMAPTPGAEDWLFVAGGKSLVKVSTTGVVSQWGIDPPVTNFVATVGAAGVLNGTYQYAVTFKNATTGSRSNPNPGFFTVPTATNPTAAPATQQVVLTDLPVSSDPQVTTVEIWRTAANLATMFKLDEVANGIATFTDNHPDTDLQDEVLPVDNARPEDTFNDVLGPYAGRAFWDRDSSVPGDAGRLFYSPVGRPESLVGFVEINNGQDPTQKAIFWGGSIYVWTNGKIFQVIGSDEPFVPREVFGCPGTTDPFSVVPTPNGVFYKAVDGVRVFDGTNSTLVGWDALALLFHGVSLEDVPTYGQTIASAYNGIELWMSDGETTLALDVRDNAWRIVRDQGATALFFETDTQLLVGSTPSLGVVIEDVHNVSTDNGAPIRVELEDPGTLIDVSVKGMVQRLYLDVNSRGALVTPTIILDDGVEVVLPPFRTTGRPDPPVEITVGRWCHIFGVRLSASVTDVMDVFGVWADIYLPAGSTAATGAPR